MQVLEKILQEIDEQIQMKRTVWDSLENPPYDDFEQSLWIAGMRNAKAIIRSHMADDGWIQVEEQGLPKENGPYWVFFATSFSGYTAKAFWDSVSNSFIWPSNGRKVKDMPTAWKQYYTPEPYRPKED